MQVPSGRDADAHASALSDAPPPAVEPALAVGTVLDERYRIERFIATGGMGVVHAARDLRLGRDVAVKIVRRGEPDEGKLRRFRQEATTLASLQHPNIVSVLDSGSQQARPYLVLELLRGQTLRQELARGALAPDRALEVAIQIARGLGAAHLAGIVHRDLKPENVICTAVGPVKLLDFGIARLHGPPPAAAGETLQNDQHHTQPGQLLGTVEYVAPEQVRGQPADARSDLFALGVVLQEMLTGKAPFLRASPLETAYAVGFAEPAPLPASIDPRLAAVVARCLEKDAARRFCSAAELESALEHARSQPPAKARSPGRLLAPALAVLALLAVVALALRPRAPAPAPLEPPVRSRVLVMPFTVQGGPEQEYLREGLVDLFSSAFELSGVQAVDPATVVHFAARESGTPALTLGRAAARRFHSRLLVVGQVVESAGRLRLSAELLDASDQDATILKVSEEGPVDDLLPMVARLATSLRARAVSQGLPVAGAAGRNARLGVSSTRFPEALKSYLQGEAMLRRGQWSDAITQLRRAVAADRKFALAHYRLAVAASIAEPGMADDAIDRALELSAALSPRDRDELAGFAAFRAGRTAEAERRYRAALAQDADDVEAWYQLGESLYHGNPLRGRPAWESSEAFNRVLLLDPDHGAALLHLINAALLQRQVEVAGRLAQRYQAAVPESPDLPAKWIAAWATHDPGARAALLDRLRRPETPYGEIDGVLMEAMVQPGDLADAQAISAIAAARPSAHEAGRGKHFLGLLELARGRPAAARALLQEAVQGLVGSSIEIDLIMIDTLPFLRPGEASLQKSLRAAAAVQPRTPEQQALLQFATGALALRLGRRDQVQQAIAALHAQPPIIGAELAQDLAWLLRARLAREAQDWAGVRRAFGKMRLELPYRNRSAWWEWTSDHLLRAELLQRDGDDRGALRWLSSFAAPDALSPIRTAPALLASARLHDRRGEVTEAVQDYRRFLELWKDAEPAQRPDVEHAEKRLAALVPGK